MSLIEEESYLKDTVDERHLKLRLACLALHYIDKEVARMIKDELVVVGVNFEPIVVIALESKIDEQQKSLVSFEAMQLNWQAELQQQLR